MIGFIINPVSGNGRGKTVWQRLETLLNEQQIPYTARFTAKPLDASLHAGELANDPAVHAVVAIGGDGTVHETVNGLFRAGRKVPFGYIPSGSGNDFARGLGLPAKPEEALGLVTGPHRLRHIDLIRSPERTSPCAAGAGFDATVSKTANSSSYKKWLNRLHLGKLSYVLSLVRVLIRFRPARAKITVDGTAHEFDRVWLVTVANIPFFGGGMKICPQADPSDGLADICVVSGIGKWDLLATFPRVYKGTHTTHPAVRFLRGKSIRIETSAPMDVHMEGETVGTTPVELEVETACIPVIVPAGQPSQTANSTHEPKEQEA